MSQPQIGGVDPADDPNGFIRELLARYFRAGLVDSYIRTWVPVGIGALLSWLNANYSLLGLPEKPSATAVTVATGVTIAGYYAIARAIEKKFPTIGKWLVALNLTRSKPLYTDKTNGELVAKGTAQTIRAQRPYYGRTSTASPRDALLRDESTRPRHSREL